MINMLGHGYVRERVLGCRELRIRRLQSRGLRGRGMSGRWLTLRALLDDCPQHHKQLLLELLLLLKKPSKYITISPGRVIPFASYKSMRKMALMKSPPR